MKSLLAKIALRKFVGLYLGDHEISVSQVAVTPLGPVEIYSHSEPCPPNELLNVIERVLQSLQGRKQRRLQVAIGLPNSRLFFGSRPLRSAGDPSPEGVMQKVLCSSDVSTDDLTIDLVKTAVNKTPVATVTACRKKYMAAVLAVLQRCGAVVCRTEPAPCALVRAAAKQHHPPRRAKTLLRIFLGASDGLAVLSVDGLPLSWRSFAVPPSSEGMAILSAARTLLSQNRHYEMATPLDYVIVHGRAELHERLQNEGLPTEIRTRMLWYEGPALCGATTALGLALGCLNQTELAFDLSRLMKPTASLRDIFPWGELACECAIIALMGLLLAHQNEQARSKCAAAQMLCDGSKVLAASDIAQLENEKKGLTQKIASIHQFLDSRVLWTSHVRDIATRLPASIQLTSFQGSSPLDFGGKGAARKTMSLGAAVALLPRGAVPPDVFALVAALRGDPLLKPNFPQVELGSISQSQKVGKNEAKARFTIACQGGK
jgi:hypothetical protein